jgi:hypothetical protein
MIALYFSGMEIYTMPSKEKHREKERKTRNEKKRSNTANSKQFKTKTVEIKNKICIEKFYIC